MENFDLIAILTVAILIISSFAFEHIIDWSVNRRNTTMRLLPKTLVDIGAILLAIPISIIIITFVVCAWYFIVLLNLLILLLIRPIQYIIFKAYIPSKFFEVPYHKYG